MAVRIRIGGIELTEEEIEVVVEAVKAGTFVHRGLVCPDIDMAIGLAGQRKVMLELLNGNGEFHHVPECSSHGNCYCLYPGVVEMIRQELGMEEQDG